ncbi:MAG: glycosyltransferase family 4 protein [Pirellulales bacterium]|nr:glycosyltransferase family 4 protein [Pirellulales bacterium]
MNLAIVHYHLNRGGVARVVENQLRALDAVLDPASRWHVAVLYGGRKQGWNEELLGQLRTIDLQLVEVPGLDYDEMGATAGLSSSAKPERLLTKLTDVLRQLGFEPEQTVLHIHNHSLGKNRDLSASVHGLAELGYALLLQIHDFAEDFRPDNYRRFASLAIDDLYPQAANVHYAVLNGRDWSVLRRSGVELDRLHLLPNPVPTVGPLPDRDAARKKLQAKFDVGPDERFLLYPVRGIRRKNLGEMLLVGLLSPPETVVGLTLAPLNPVETPDYTAWKETASRLNLPCRFEVGGPGALRFDENMAAADVMLTTSLAEGFGMVMLEPWSAGRALVGRNLPEITTDFTKAGLRLDGLWNRLAVPLAWVGRERFIEKASNAYQKVLAACDWPLSPDWETVLREKTRDDVVDFGDLDESMQKDVLQVLVGNPEGRQYVLDHNPDLNAMLAVDMPAAAATIKHNVRVVEGQFSLVPSGRRLSELLLRVADSPRGGRLGRLAHPERILGSFLDPRRFRMIRG